MKKKKRSIFCISTIVFPIPVPMGFEDAGGTKCKRRGTFSMSSGRNGSYGNESLSWRLHFAPKVFMQMKREHKY